jgi:outer membrane protein TolC
MNIRLSSAGAFFCLLLFAFSALAQNEPVVLTLDETLELAMEKSYSARIQRLTLIRAEQRVRAQKGRFRTQISMQLNAPSFTESVDLVRVPNETPYYNTFGSLRWQSNLNITQPLPTNGEITLRSTLYQTRESVFQDQIDVTEKEKRFYSQFRLGISQPLFVPNDLKLELERANLEHEQARRNYTRTELDVIYNVSEAFYGLYRAKRQLEIAQAELDQQEQAHNLAQRKFEAGLIPEVDALQMQVDLARSRNDLLNAEGNLSQEIDRFKLTVGLPMDEEIDVSTDLEINPFTVDEEKAVDHGLLYRSEIRDRQIERRLAEISLKETDAQSAIRGTISAYYDLTGVSDPFLDYSSSVSRYFRSSIEDLKNRPRNRGITFSLSLPIWDSGVNRAQVAAARATLEQRQIDEEEERRVVTREIRAVISRIEESRGQLDVLRQSQEVALRSFEISQARFDNGDITSQDLANNRDRLTETRLNYLSAFINYQLAVADLKRNTLYDWEKGVSLVEGASAGNGNF